MMVEVAMAASAEKTVTANCWSSLIYCLQLAPCALSRAPSSTRQFLFLRLGRFGRAEERLGRLLDKAHFRATEGSEWSATLSHLVHHPLVGPPVHFFVDPRRHTTPLTQHDTRDKERQLKTAKLWPVAVVAIQKAAMVFTKWQRNSNRCSPRPRCF